LCTKLCICCSNFSVEKEKEKSEHSASGLSLDASPGGSPGRAPGRNAPAAVDLGTARRLRLVGVLCAGISAPGVDPSRPPGACWCVRAINRPLDETRPAEKENEK